MNEREGMLISVVMPAYNASKTICMAIDSVLSQTYRNLELIVINDCSRDETPLIVEDYIAKDGRVKLLTNEQNSGVSMTRKRGVDAAQGKWIAFLDSDDAWTAFKLEKQVAVQKKHKAKLVFTGSTFINAESKPIDWVLHAPQEIDYRKLLKQNLVSNSSVLICKEAYQRCAMVDDSLHEDFACWLNFLKEESCAYGIDEPLLIYRLSASSKSGNKLKAAQMNWNTYRAVGLNIFEASYYMIWYIINGLLKYRNLKGWNY